MEVRRYQSSDWDELFRLTQLLFPGDDAEAEAAELRTTLARADAAVFVLDRGDGKLGGYVEAGNRKYAEGCVSSPVGYIEAWYVDADLRRSGHGRALLEAAENWARDRGYSEMASDALLENEVSHNAHRRSGYEEVERGVMFRKQLSADPPMPPNIKLAVPLLLVNDMQRSLAFYVDGLGAKVTTTWIVSGKVEWCWMELDDTAIMLQELRSGHSAREAKKGVGVSINFVCNDAIRYYRELKSRGIDARRPFVGNSMWVTSVSDPDGYELNFESFTDAPEESEYSG